MTANFTHKQVTHTRGEGGFAPFQTPTAARGGGVAARANALDMGNVFDIRYFSALVPQRGAAFSTLVPPRGAASSDMQYGYPSFC